MSVFRRVATSAAVIALCQTPVPSLAYGEGGGGGGSSMTGGSGASSGFTNATTKAVVKTLTRGGSRCARLPRVYQFDCYRWVYKRASDQLLGNPSYSEAQKAMAQVESALDAAVKQNRDTSQPVRRRALETYKPIKPAAVPRVTRQAEQAMTTAETTLLRSPSNKQEHYARIAEAVNSNKVLLRSALLPGSLIRLASAMLAKLIPQS